MSLNSSRVRPTATTGAVLAAAALSGVLSAVVTVAGAHPASAGSPARALSTAPDQPAVRRLCGPVAPGRSVLQARPDVRQADTCQTTDTGSLSLPATAMDATDADPAAAEWISAPARQAQPAGSVSTHTGAAGAAATRTPPPRVYGPPTGVGPGTADPAPVVPAPAGPAPAPLAAPTSRPPAPAAPAHAEPAPAPTATPAPVARSTRTAAVATAGTAVSPTQPPSVGSARTTTSPVVTSPAPPERGRNPFQVPSEVLRAARADNAAVEASVGDTGTTMQAADPTTGAAAEPAPVYSSAAASSAAAVQTDAVAQLVTSGARGTATTPQHAAGARNPFLMLLAPEPDHAEEPVSSALAPSSALTPASPLVATAPLGSSPVDRQVLTRRGDTGPVVRTLQQQLDDHGSHLAVDGIFGPLTKAAVSAFQQRSGLAVDGIVGPQTRAALRA